MTSSRVMAQAPFRVAAKSPRPALRKRDSFPFARISRMIAALSVAAGVLPLVFQRPLSSTLLVRSAQRMGCFADARTLAAASRPLRGLAAGGGLAPPPLGVAATSVLAGLGAFAGLAPLFFPSICFI